MVFILRIDLESDKGIKKGVPKILALLDKFNFKASFYLVMGGESNIFEILKYSGKLKSAGERKINIWSLKEKIRMILFPKDFVSSNKKILKKILDEGHELGIHGWKHRAWTRGLDEIDVERHLNLAIRRYRKIFGIYPRSFAAPGFNTNNKVIKVLDKKNIKVISDFEGNKPFKIKKTGITNVPITIKGGKNTPIIEFLVSKGYTDNEILEYLKDKIKKKGLSVIYIHDLYECIKKIHLLENLFIFLKKSKIKIKTIKQIGEKTKR